MSTNLAEQDCPNKAEKEKQQPKSQIDGTHKEKKQTYVESALQQLDAREGGFAEESDEESNQSIIDSEEEEYLCSEQGAGMTDEQLAEKSVAPIDKEVLDVREMQPIEEKQNIEEHAAEQQCQVFTLEEQIVEEQFELISGSAENPSGACVSPKGKALKLIENSESYKNAFTKQSLIMTFTITLK